jgi:hypothetical protein
MVVGMSSRAGRRSRDETARLIREAAVGLLERDGLRGFSNSVRLDDALNVLLEDQGIRLTHGSIYGRIWVDQRDFQLDVVATTVGRYDGSDVAAAFVAALASGPDEVVREDVKEMFGAAVEAARRSRMWNLWIGAHAAVVSTPGREDDNRLAGALAQAHDQVVSSLAGALETVTGQSHGTDPGEAAQILLTQLIGVSITRDASGAAAVLADVLLPR